MELMPVLLIATAALATGEKSLRDPRFFFGNIESSTATTTITSKLETHTFCYTTMMMPPAPIGPCRRRKRSIIEDPLSGQVDAVVPSSPEKRTENEIWTEVESGREEAKVPHRGARKFALFFNAISTILSTETSTSTVFTGTVTLQVACLPREMNSC